MFAYAKFLHTIVFSMPIKVNHFRIYYRETYNQQYMEKIKTKVCENEQCLSIEDELQLIKDIKSGGTERKTAIERLAHSKLRFVTAVAKIFKGCGLSMEELVNAGNEGLVLAAENYDESRGFKFMSYAVLWIRQSIMQKIQ